MITQGRLEEGNKTQFLFSRTGACLQKIFAFYKHLEELQVAIGSLFVLAGVLITKSQANMENTQKFSFETP